MKLSILTSLLFTTPTASFLFPRNFDVNPNLASIAKAQTGITLDIGLQVSDAKNQSKLYIDGLSLELICQPTASPTAPAITTSTHQNHIIPLPGINGPNPHVSTGPLHLIMKNPGSFVSLQGTQKLTMEQQAWEMVWINNRPTGSIICGFHLDEPMVRNDAILPSGNLYLNFRIWTPAGLHTARNEKMAYERELSKQMKIQKEELEKCNASDNPIQKAMHFRKAVTANELISIMKTDKHDTVPMEECDVITVGEGLLVAKEGSIFTTVMEKNMLGGNKENHYFVGGAILKDSK
jgi:hypothetical protein